MKKILFMLTTLLLSVLLISCGGSSNTYKFIIDEEYTSFITMGTSADYPPYEWPMRDGNKTTRVCIDIEIAKLIAKELEMNLIVIDKGFDFLLEDLENGKVDFVIAGLSPTADRAKIVDFSNVYYLAKQVVLVKESNLEKFSSIEALDKSSIRIGAQLGTIQQEILEDEFSNAHHHIIQNMQNLMMNLNDGQIDALIVEEPVANSYINQLNNLAISPILIGDPEGGNVAAVAKGNTQLLNAINKVIDELITTGKIDEIITEMVNLNSN